MININGSAIIYKPIKQVFDFVCASENDFEWQYGILTASGHAARIGSFFRSVGHLMGQRFVSTYEVTEYEPNQKYGFKSLSGPLNLYTLFTFEMAHGSTIITSATQANVVNLIQINESILEKRMRRQLKDNLAMLKTVLETKRNQPPTKHI
jgi:hypothetical protein